MGPSNGALAVGVAGGGADCGAASAAEASPPSQRPSGQKRPRLVGLDMLRGLTMAVMLLVDYAGTCYPSIDHAPWNGIHLADFVMPFFLWVSGVSMSISLRVRPGESPWKVFATAARRAVRLFLLGIVVQGGWYRLEKGMPVLRFDLSTVRWLGILQRIALAFLLLAAAELLPPRARAEAAAAAGGERLLPPAGAAELAVQREFHGFAAPFRARGPQWCVALAAAALGIVLTYGVRPPDSWAGCAPSVYLCADSAAGCTSQEDEDQLKQMGCSAVGFLDSHVLGVSHTYIRGSKVPSWPPTWGFDPEGLVTTCSAVLPMAFGLHIGFVWRALRDVQKVLLHWLVLGVALTAFASVLSIWVPLNKRLWSPSYSLLMCGLAALIYSGLFLVVDASAVLPASLRRFSRWAKAILSPLQWLGENCILFFVLSDCCGVLDLLLRSITWGKPYTEKNVVAWFQNTVLMQWFGLGSSCAGMYAECGPAVMTYVWIEILLWVIVCGVLHRQGIFWKI
uniref:Heparan-alpha-glucosaminide N-acetyltransferase catalytic domain-containing protein n=1 Tax=Alexandrium monilatum TaxID=311494 RepID=A0A7S4Q9P3_9DINO